MKVPVVRRPEYTVALQDEDGNTFAHCDVREWSSGVLKRLRADADALYRLHGGPWIAVNQPTGDEKHQRFMRLVGFEYWQTVETEMGPLILFKR